MALQVVLPWTAHHWISQDGGSHLYNAMIVRDLLTKHDTPYASVYTVQKAPIPNWTITLLFIGATAVVGPAHADQVIASLVILAFFFGFSYLVSSLGAPKYSPVANFLAQSTFLIRGYYNFYLSMAIALVVIGFYIRRRHHLSMRTAAILTLAWLGLFFTHLLGAALAITAVLAIAIATRPLGPEWRLSEAFRDIALLIAAAFPVAALVALFVLGAPSEPFPRAMFAAISWFPLYLFTVSIGPLGREELLRGGMILYFVLGVLSTRRRLWPSPLGGVLFTAALSFALYIVIPDRGLSGSDIKVRFAWAACIFAAAVAVTNRRLKPVNTAFALYSTVLIAAALVLMARVNMKASAAFDTYTAAFANLRHGCTFVRVMYPLDEAYKTLGWPNEMLISPLRVADSYAAALHGCISLTNYEAPARHFPVLLKDTIRREDQRALANLEAAKGDSIEYVRELPQKVPVPIDYYVVLGDRQSGGAPTDAARLISDLQARGMREVSTAGSPPFVTILDANR